MGESSEIIIVDKESIDIFDPHGYFVSFTRPELNFQSPTKRSFLNECIRQIYILNGDSMPTIPNKAVYNRYHMRNTLNDLMVSVDISDFQAKVDKVKRRLFQDTKMRPRKINNNFRNNIIKTECFYYKHQRSELGARKIPRNYLDDARHQVYAELRQKLKRKHMDADDDDDDDDDDSDYSDSFHFTTEEGECQVSGQVLSKRYCYHGTMPRSHSQHEDISIEEQIKWERRLSHRAKRLEEVRLEKQYQERFKANETTLKASVRSILYLQTLRDILLRGSSYAR